MSQQKKVVYFAFTACRKELDDSCVEPSELEAFMTAHQFFVHKVENFINFEDVKPFEETLEQSLDYLLIKKVDITKHKVYKVKLVQSRNSFSDSRFNFMDLAEPKQLDYLNFDEIVEELQSPQA